VREEVWKFVCVSFRGWLERVANMSAVSRRTGEKLETSRFEKEQWLVTFSAVRGADCGWWCEEMFCWWGRWL
jgi:hypothetical protein